MKRISGEYRYLVRSRYIRYRELSVLSTHLSRITSFGKWCFGGGIVIFLAWCFQIAMENQFSDVPAGIGLSAFIIGWLIKLDSVPRYRSVTEEMREIENELKELDITISDFQNTVTTYYVEISEASKFNPLSDDAFEQ